MAIAEEAIMFAKCVGMLTVNRTVRGCQQYIGSPGAELPLVSRSRVTSRVPVCHFVTYYTYQQASIAKVTCGESDPAPDLCLLSSRGTCAGLRQIDFVVGRLILGVGLTGFSAAEQRVTVAINQKRASRSARHHPS
jgi:hypothetical protein